MRKGLLLIISGPSGAGKGTLIDRLRAEDRDLAFSVSVTTRAPRPHETDGVEYRFITEAEFFALRDAGGLLESAVVHDRYYGTPKAPIERVPAEGRDIILDIDTQGALSTMALYPESVSVFVVPPSLAELERRLRNRRTETEAQVEKRLTNAKAELSLMPRYQYVLLNDRLEDALAQLRAIIVAERLRTARFLPEIL